MTPPWSVVYYQSEDGDVPFLVFIDRLKTQQARAECYALIEFMEKRGGTLDREKTHLTHANGLQELQGQFVRIFYVSEPDDHLIVVIDGMFPGEAGKLFDDILRKAEDYAS